MVIVCFMEKVIDMNEMNDLQLAARTCSSSGLRHGDRQSFVALQSILEIHCQNSIPLVTHYCYYSY